MNQSAADQLACSNDSKGKLVQVEAFVFTTIILLGILLVFGALRRRSQYGFLSFLLLVIYTIVSQAIPYVMGLMKSAPFSHELFPVWAAMLLFAYGSADNMSARNLEERQSASEFLWRFIIQFFWLALLFYKSIGTFTWPLVFLVLLMFIKVAERGLALKFASKTPGVDSTTMRIADYMKTEHQLTDNVDERGPVTMQGYKYLLDITDVKVEDHKIKEGITIEEIWQCQGRLLSSTGGDPDGLLKDTCLSLALFWLLLRKFAGYPLHESLHPKTWNFVQNKLLSEEDGHERGFRVIEVELNFLFDYFYTKYFAYYYSKYIMKIPSIVLVLLFGSSTMYNLKRYKPRQDDVRLLYDNYDVDILVTWVLVAIIVVLEITQLCFLVTSRWFKVTMLCCYVKKQLWRKETKMDQCTEKLIEIICWMPNSATMSKPWQRKLNQYSLLDSHKMVLNNFAVRMLQINLQIPIATLSRKELDNVALTPELKKAVVLSLKGNGPRLPNGIDSLKRNGVESLLPDFQLEMKTDHILVWHVATTLCEIHSELNPPLAEEERSKDNFHVATTLSRYCAYLVAKAPRLLPDHAYNCNYIYNTVIQDVKRLLRKCDSRQDIYKKMVDGIGGEKNLVKDGTGEERIPVKDGIGEEKNQGNVLRKGAILGKKLIHEIKDQEQRWKVLADFWAELILYLAPSNDELAHAKCLANGGEFITHLWALLIHAGIHTRDEVSASVTTNQDVHQMTPAILLR